LTGDDGVLLEDYALHCLAADPSELASGRYAAIGPACEPWGSP
jgi:hypothetical protein